MLKSSIKPLFREFKVVVVARNCRNKCDARTELLFLLLNLLPFDVLFATVVTKAPYSIGSTDSLRMQQAPLALTASKERRLYSQASQLRTGKSFSIHPIPPYP